MNRLVLGTLTVAVVGVSCARDNSAPVADTAVVSDSTSLSSAGDIHLDLLTEIGADATRDQLAAKFGEENVTDSIIYFVDGVSEPGSILFARDSSRRVEITWIDSVTKSRPGLIRLYGSTSVWKFPHGLALGMTMSELERLNGRPFDIMGFGWDYGGGITNWNGGDLKDLSTGTPAVMLRLSPEDPAPNEVLGEKELSSDLPVMKRIDPVIDRIMVSYERR